MAVALPVAMAAVQIGQNISSSKIAGGEANLQAQQIELGAKQREADRKERLSLALASQNAAAGAGGIAAFEGSPLTIMNEDIRRAEQETERDQFSSQLEIMTAKNRASIAKRGFGFNSLIAGGEAATKVLDRQ